MASRSVLLLALAAAFSTLVAAVPAADFVFRNGSLYTMDKANSKAEAIAIKDGAISYVGTDKNVNKYISNKTTVVDLEGRMAMPGLVDSHMHVLSGGLYLMKCDLSYQALDLEELLEHLQTCLDSETDKTDDDWLEAVSMDYSSLISKSGTVTKIQLDTLNTSRPLIVRSSDYHTVLANSRALDLSNITADTPDPSNGVIGRLSGSNEPSGVLSDDAYDLLAGPPDPTDEEYLEAARAALKLLREAGITTFQEAAATAEHHTVFSAIKAEGGLSSRAYFDYRIEAPSSLSAVATLVSEIVSVLAGYHDTAKPTPKPTLKWQAVKAFIDGVITYPANTAALIEPYWTPVNGSDDVWAPDPDGYTDPYWNATILSKTLELLFLAGVDAQLHVDGDLAVRIALDAAEAFGKKYPKRDFRLGLAHDELSHEDDWPRFAKLKVDPIVSYQWSQLSSSYIPDTFHSLGEYRKKNLQSWAQFEKYGRDLIYGSDWPVSSLRQP